jgi:hypothetical protein
MKVIYIETNEEITSIIDRIKKTQGRAISVVVPKRAALTQSIVNLKLLKKEANKLDKRLTIITNDKVGKNLASKAGFLVEKKVKEASSSDIPEDAPEPDPSLPTPLKIEVIHTGKKNNQNTAILPPEKKIKISDIVDTPSHHPSSEKIKKRKKKISALTPSFNKKEKKINLIPSLGSKMIAIFVLLSLVVASVFAFIFLPRGTITLKPKTERLSKELKITADAKQNEADLTNNQIPAKLIEINKAKEETFKATGKKEIRNKATGTVTLYNEFDSNPQPLPAGTKLTAENGLVFETTQSVEIPGFQRVDGEDLPGKITVGIKALEAGDKYNIDPTRFTIPSFQDTPKFINFYAISSKPTSNGETSDVTVVSEEDLLKSQEKLESDLIKEIQTELNNSSQDYYLDKKAISGEKKFSSSKKADEEAEDFQASLKITQKALAFKEEDIFKIAQNLFNDNLGNNQILAENVVSEIIYKEFEYNLDQGKITFTAIVNAPVAYEIDKEKLKESLKNKEYSEANNLLRENKEIENFQIELWPFWVKKIPRNLNRIEIILDTSS